MSIVVGSRTQGLWYKGFKSSSFYYNVIKVGCTVALIGQMHCNSSNKRQANRKTLQKHIKQKGSWIKQH